MAPPIRMVTGCEKKAIPLYTEILKNNYTVYGNSQKQSHCIRKFSKTITLYTEILRNNHTVKGNSQKQSHRIRKFSKTD